MQDYAYAYVVGNLLLGVPIWAWLFFTRKDLRREMLLAGALIAFLAIVWEPWFLADYWNPEPGHPWRRAVGDVLYGFLVGGIASVVYAGIMRKRMAAARSARIAWARLFLPCAVIGFLAFQALVSLGLHSISAASAVFLSVAVLMVALRRDLFADALLSGAIMTGLTFVGYLVFIAIWPGIIQAWWKIPAMSGLFVRGVPVEELVWAFAFGAVAGPSYEFFAGLKYRK